MPNAKDLEKGRKNILNYGPTGTGKTWLFTTFPGKKFVYAFDPSTLDTIAGLDIDYEYVSPKSSLGIHKTQEGRTDPKGPKYTEPLAFRQFEDHLEKFLEEDIETYDVIAFCSLTTLQLILLERILYINGRFGQTPQIADYMLLGDTLLAIFRTCFAKEVTFYLEAHSDLVQDDVSKKIVNQLDLSKGLRRNLTRLLTDLWVSSAEAGRDGPIYKIQTAPTREFPAAKNSMKLKQFEDVTFDPKRKLDEQGIGRFLRGRR